MGTVVVPRTNYVVVLIRVSIADDNVMSALHSSSAANKKIWGLARAAVEDQKCRLKVLARGFGYEVVGASKLRVQLLLYCDLRTRSTVRSRTGLRARRRERL